MPKISEFYGIRIYVYYDEHPPPHFHALYQGSQVLVSIDDLSVLTGKIQPRAMGLVMEWATLHRDDLNRVWEQAVAHEPLDWIPPLE